MNILLVGKRTSQESVGVMQKLAGQAAAFAALGHRVYTTDITEDGGWLEHADNRQKIWQPKHYFPAAMSPQRNHAQTLLAAAQQEDVHFDLCYIRKPLCDALHLQALKALRRHSTVIVEEIPTYPYDPELKQQHSLAGLAFLGIDRFWRRRLQQYVHRIATYSYDEKIFGVPTVQLNNAVDTSAITPRTPPAKSQVLRLGAVSSMFFWHGYDRLLHGMAAYAAQPGARRVSLQLVGDGPERENWQRLSAQLGLKDSVTFHGVQTGNALQAILAQCDVAVSSLGWHRKGIAASFELKTREYIARGIPFVYACHDEAAGAVAPYSLRVPDDDTPVGIPAIVAFFEGIDPQTAAAVLQAYAKKHLRWGTQMQKVIDACKDVLPPK